MSKQFTTALHKYTCAKADYCDALIWAAHDRLHGSIEDYRESMRAVEVRRKDMLVWYAHYKKSKAKKNAMRGV